jgi:O-antigen/teichoic acid export membrane protein
LRLGAIGASLRGGVPKILLGSLIGQGSLLAISPLLTRIYTPDDFGALAAFTAFATVLGGIVTVSWERGIVVPRSEFSARALAVLGVMSAVGVSVAMAVLILFIGPALDDLLDVDVFDRFWWLLPATTLAMGLYGVLSSLLVRARAYSRLAARNALQGLAQSVSSVLLGVSGFGAIGLLTGILVGRVASTLGLARWRRADGFPSVARLRAVARRYRRFPLVSTWSRALNSLGLQLPVLMIVAIYGSMEAGMYALTVRVLATPIGIVVDAVSQYFEGAFSSRLRARSGGLVTLITGITKRLALVAAVPMMVIIIFGPVLFAWAFGSNWRDAGVLAQITVGFYAVQFVVAPISRTLLVLERQGTQLAWDVLRMVATSLAVIVPSLLGMALSGALLVLAISQVALYLAMYALCVRAARAEEGKGDMVGARP